jgi:hypothetical protein
MKQAVRLSSPIFDPFSLSLGFTREADCHYLLSQLAINIDSAHLIDPVDLWIYERLSLFQAPHALGDPRSRNPIFRQSMLD